MALRRLIEDAEASGISECSAKELLAEVRALSDERRRAEAMAEGHTMVTPPGSAKG